MEQTDKKKKKKRILLIGLGTITTGVLGFFGWQWWKDRKANKQQSQQGNASTPGANTPASNGGGSYSPPQDTSSYRSSYRAPSSGGSSDFPLKKGSRGTKVKALQEALISKYGASILPRYGADGDFGNEVATALAKEGLPSQIDESTFNALTGGSNGNSGNNGGGSNTNSSVDAKSISDNLYNAIENSDFNGALAALKQMHSVDDYKAVNTQFETHRFWFVRKTIVTALLDTFTDESQKVKLRLELTRIGLKYDGSKFSLSGIPYKLITRRDTLVTDKNGNATPAAANLLLGYPIGIRDSWVYFFPFNADILLRVRKQDVNISRN